MNKVYAEIDKAVKALEDSYSSEGEDYPGEARDYYLDKVWRLAVDIADHLILEASDGSTEETNYLTSQVAQKFVEKALIPHNSALLKKRLEERKK